VTNAPALPDLFRASSMTAALGMVISTIGEVLFGIELRWVEEIEAPLGRQEPQEHRDEDPTLLDLAQLWGIPAALEQRRRRVLQLRTSRGPRRLMVGAQTSVLAIPRRNFRDLPPLVEGLVVQAAISGLFLLDPRIGYLLEVDQLEGLRPETDRPISLNAGARSAADE
jgi:hypothetical protein